jgi:hypothetical protein
MFYSTGWASQAGAYSSGAPFSGEKNELCNLIPGVNVIKLFSSSLMMRPNKLEGLSFKTLSSWVFEFVGKARANSVGGPFRCFLLGQAPGVVSKCRTRLESDCQVQAT